MYPLTPSFVFHFFFCPTNSAVCRIGREGHVPKILLPVLRRHHNPNPACIHFPAVLAALVPRRTQGRKRRSIPERRGPYELCEIDLHVDLGNQRPAHTANFCKLYTVHKIDFDIKMPQHYLSTTNFAGENFTDAKNLAPTTTAMRKIGEEPASCRQDPSPFHFSQ